MDTKIESEIQSEQNEENDNGEKWTKEDAINMHNNMYKFDAYYRSMIDCGAVLDPTDSDYDSDGNFIGEIESCHGSCCEQHDDNDYDNDESDSEPEPDSKEMYVALQKN